MTTDMGHTDGAYGGSVIDGSAPSSIDPSTIPELGYGLQFDWAHDGFSFTGINATYQDLTSRLMGKLTTWRGRDKPNPLAGRAGPGQMTFALQNLDLLLSPTNTLSPLNAYMDLKTQVRWIVSIPNYYRFVGLITDMYPDHIGKIPVVRFVVDGMLSWFRENHISPAASPGEATSAIMTEIVTAAGFPYAYTTQVGQTDTSRWFVEDKDALEAMREIEETERGFLFEAANGTITFQNRINRITGAALVSKRTFGDVYSPLTAPITTYGMWLSVDEINELPFVFNDAKADITPYADDVLQTCWQLTGEVPTLQPGETRVWWTTLPAGASYVTSWTTPDSSDVTVTGGVFGSLTITVSKFAKTMKISITNGNAGAVNLTLLRARGIPVFPGDVTTVRASNPTTYAQFGVKSYKIPSPWLPSTNIGQSYVNFIVNNYSALRKALRIKFLANASKYMFAMLHDLELSDRITILCNRPLTGMFFTLDFFVERIEDVFDVDNHRYEITLEVSQVGTETDGGGGGGADLWILGTSILGSHTYLDA